VETIMRCAATSSRSGPSMAAHFRAKTTPPFWSHSLGRVEQRSINPVFPSTGDVPSRVEDCPRAYQLDPTRRTQPHRSLNPREDTHGNFPFLLILRGRPKLFLIAAKILVYFRSAARYR